MEYKPILSILIEKLAVNQILIYDMDDNEILQALIDCIVDDNLNIEIWHSCSNICTDCKRIKCVSSDNIKSVIEIYRLYEFSDKIIIFSKNTSYPDLTNYLTYNIISVSELAKAMTGIINTR